MRSDRRQLPDGAGHSGGEVGDGALVGEQVREDHGATLRWSMDYGGVDLDFEFNGGKRFNIVFDDKPE